MAFRRKSREPDPDHPAPVEIDLGVFPGWQVELVVEVIKSQGLRISHYTQDESARQGGITRHTVLVHPDDLDAVRRHLIDGELLEG